MIQGPPFPLALSLLSIVFLGDTATGFDAWGLFERWGIAAAFGVIAWLLWKKDRETASALEAQRLEVQKELLQAHKDNATNMQALIVSNMSAQNATASALHELAEKVHVIPCRANHTPQ